MCRTLTTVELARTVNYGGPCGCGDTGLLLGRSP